MKSQRQLSASWKKKLAYDPVDGCDNVICKTLRFNVDNSYNYLRVIWQ
jgi:hypothetical protein